MSPDAKKVATEHLAQRRASGGWEDDPTWVAIKRIRSVLEQNLGSEARNLKVDSWKPGVVYVTWNMGGLFHRGQFDLAYASDLKNPPNTYNLTRKAAFALFALSKLFSSRQLDIRHLRVSTKDADGKEVNLAIMR